jgi:hypothetical protein
MTDKTDSKERAGRFTKKPVTIDAWLIDFGNKPLPDWVNEAFRTEAIDWCPAGEGLYINTLEGHMLGTKGSWLIKGVQGELYACKPDIFAATYERASLAASAGSEPVAQLAAERDELFQAAIDFIRTLTGMEPPPIEVAPPEVFAPFHAFVNTIQAITNKRNSPPREGMVMVPKEPTHHMLNAAASAYEDARQSLGAYNAPWAAYRAMLEVAAPPTSSADSR